MDTNNTRQRVSIPLNKILFSPLILYCTIIFFLSTGDAIMSYVSPIFIEDKVNNPLIMGIILSASSLVGLTCDLLFPQWFRKKRYSFFLLAAIVCALTFPLLFILFPPHIIVLLFAMLIWGIYYEFMVFSNFNFINKHVTPKEHASSWGILETFRSTAYLIGPIMASLLLSITATSTLYITLIFVLFSFICFMTFFKYRLKSEVPEAKPASRNPLQELKLWGVLLKKIWPLFLFTLILGLIDSAFWSVGTLLSEDLKNQNFWGGFLLPAYMLPSLILAFIAGRAAKSFGKKRAAFWSGIFGGILLFVAYLSTNPALIVLIVFLSSIFLSLANVEMTATFEDYVGRVGIFVNDVIGLQSSSVSLAYIIGPVMAGSLAFFGGYRFVFIVMGGLLAAFSILALIIVPRKIKMPIAALEDLKA